MPFASSLRNRRWRARLTKRPCGDRLCRTAALAPRLLLSLRSPNRRAVSAEIAVQEHIRPERMDAHRRAGGFADALQRRQRKTRSSRAENDRSDNDMEAIEAARGEETRHGFGAALHQNSAQSALRQRHCDRGRRDAVTLRRKGNLLDALRKHGRTARGCEHDALNMIPRQQAGLWR